MKIEIEIPDCDPGKGESDTELIARNLPPSLSYDQVLEVFSVIAHVTDLRLIEEPVTHAYFNVATPVDGHRLLAATIMINGRIIRISRAPMW